MYDHIIEQYASKKELARSDAGILLNMEKAAQELGPDKHLHNLTKAEVLQYLTNLELTSYQSVRKYISMLKRFLSYCMDEGIIPQGDNVGDSFTKQEMESCLCVYASQKTISKELIDRFVHKLANPSDRFLVLGSFEGFSIKEFLDLYDDNFDFTNGKIFKPQNLAWFTYSDHLMHIGRAALDIAKYGSGRTSVPLLEPVPGKKAIIKIGWGGKRPTAISLRRRIILRAAEAGSEYRHLTLKLIHTYGFFYSLEQNIDGLPVEEFIDNQNPNYRQLLARYGKELKHPYQVLEEYKYFREEQNNELIK